MWSASLTRRCERWRIESNGSTHAIKAPIRTTAHLLATLVDVGPVGRGEAQSFYLLLHDDGLRDTMRRRLTLLKDTEDGFLIADEDFRLSRTLRESERSSATDKALMSEADFGLGWLRVSCLTQSDRQPLFRQKDQLSTA